jgi:hypothetical protein
MATPAVISDDEKRAALARVLESRTFGRADQLRAFLRYVCEAELAGRAHELNEYALGVSVLGRREGYSPAEDSGVRSRAYELRGKLRSYYRDEAPDDPVQIEIEKGAYVPRFHRRGGDAEAAPTAEAPAAPPPAAPAPAAPPAEPPAAAAAAPSPAARWWPSLRSILIPLASVMALAVLVAIWAHTRPSFRAQPPAAATPEMQALWGPFLDGKIPVLVSFEARLFLYAPAAELVVRDFRTNQAADVPASRPLAAFRQRMGADELVETHDYADVGAVQAAFALGRFLNREAGLKYSSALGWQDLWNSNVIFVGKSNVDETVRRVLGDANLDFVDSDAGSVVRNLRPLPGEPTEYRNATTHGAGKKYGIITVLPGPQPGHHVMLLTASAAELLWPLAHSVTDPTRVAEIMSHVMRPSGEAPPAFQVVIEATFQANVPTSVRYVTHHAYKPRN